MTACASAEKRAENTPVVSVAAKVSADLAYKVQPGDFLSRIAQNTTGDGENWRVIARYNNIKNPNKLKKNDTIMIPGHLLPEDKSKTLIKEVTIAPIEKKPSIIEVKPKEQPENIHQARNNSEWVMVEGSYYPKAVYRKPNYTGGMLTRVLPGTTLKYIKSGKNWIQVETEKGRGYLHRSDARRLSKNELSLKTSSEY